MHIYALGLEQSVLIHIFRIFYSHFQNFGRQNVMGFCCRHTTKRRQSNADQCQLAGEAFMLPYHARVPRNDGRKHRYVIINLLRVGHMPELQAYRSTCMFDVIRKLVGSSTVCIMHDVHHVGIYIYIGLYRGRPATKTLDVLHHVCWGT